MNGLSVLQRLGSGSLIDQIDDALCSVASEVSRSGKPGSVTITLKVSHPKGADAAVVVVDEDVKRTPPRTDPKGAMFFALDDELHARDPRQEPLPEFRVVKEQGQTELRTPAEAAGEAREVNS